MRPLLGRPFKCSGCGSRDVSLARHMGITDEQADQAVAEALAQRRIIGDGSNPPHSVTLFLGLRESDEKQCGVGIM